MSAAAQLSTEQFQDAVQRANKLAAESKIGGGQFEDNRSMNGHNNIMGDHSGMMGGPAVGAGMSAAPMMGQMPQQGISPGGVQDNHCETIEVPDNTVGLIIGRGGDQISNIQATSHCRVQMAPDSGGQSVRQCTLHGTQESIDKAKEMIFQIIERASNRPHGGGHMQGPDDGKFAGMNMFNGGGMARGGQVTSEMLIPGPKCGLIIGKGGETIKSLQEKASVKMVMIQEDQQQTGAPKPLRISGDPEKVEYAKQLVEELLNRNEQGGMMGGGHPGMGGGMYGGGQGGYGGPGGRSMGEVIVPRGSVGLIIGKGGEMIKKLAADTGARIQFKNDEPVDAEQRTAVIHGTVDQIGRATQLITDLVNRSQQNGEPDVFYMHVPANKTGLVIGRGGDTIKSINAESGAHVELSRDDNNPNAPEKVFVIKGSAYQIHVATHLIRVKVGDIAAGTPIPPFHGPGGQPAAGATPNQFGGAQPGGYGQQAYGQQQQPAQGSWPQTGQYGANGQVQSGAGSDPNAWNYYQQQQQMQTQPQQQQYQQPGQQSAGAQVNPSTGQPDYSQQWIEYYRSMGMHEQAAVIEAQTRANAQNRQPQQQQAQYGGFTAGAMGGAQTAQTSQGGMGGQFGGGYTSGTAAGYPAAYQ